MNLLNGKSKYPPRAYKRESELSLKDKDINNITYINSLTVADEIVHANTEGSEIVQFLEGKSIFITGGTGFVGKLLIEKLLRSCKGIKKIYLLVREKRNINAETRMKQTLDDIVFSELVKVQPNFRDKIVTVEGDAALPNLGINKKSQELLECEVDIIFHAAATVSFQEKLEIAARINIGGTQELLKLAKKCKNLVSLVYVSTAYSNCHLEEIEEKFYEPPYTAEGIFDLINKYGDKLVDNENLIIGKWPNTSKAIAEHTIKIHAKDLPACIFRPAIIISTYREPIRSYIDNYYAAVGTTACTYRGMLRTFYCDPEVVGDMVPADLVVNGIIAAAYRNHSRRDDNLKIYNFISSKENPMTYRDFSQLSIFYGRNIPTLNCVWYPTYVLIKNRYMHLLYTIFLHILPAFLVDSYLLMSGRKPWAISVYKKIYKFNNSLAFFATKEWIFSNENTQKLWQDLSLIDQKIFNFNLSPEYLNWNEYLSTICGGIRLHLLKDGLQTLPDSLKKQKRLYYYHVLVRLIFVVLLVFIGFRILRFLLE